KAWITETEARRIVWNAAAQAYLREQRLVRRRGESGVDRKIGIRLLVGEFAAEDLAHLGGKATGGPQSIRVLIAAWQVDMEPLELFGAHMARLDQDGTAVGVDFLQADALHAFGQIRAPRVETGGDVFRGKFQQRRRIFTQIADDDAGVDARMAADGQHQPGTAIDGRE